MKDITEINQTLEEHTKKVVQMHYLARNLTAKMNEELMKGEKSTFFWGNSVLQEDFLGEDWGRRACDSRGVYRRYF